MIFHGEFVGLKVPDEIAGDPAVEEWARGIVDTLDRAFEEGLRQLVETGTCDVRALLPPQTKEEK